MSTTNLKTAEFPTTIIMGIPFSKLSLIETENYLTRRINLKETTHVVTANPEIVMYAEKSSAYNAVLKKADMIVPDGIGIVYASIIQKNRVKERVAGYDLLHRLMYQANLNKWKVYLLGAKEEANKLAYEKLKHDYPNALFVGRHHGYFQEGSELETNILKEIKSSDPDILFVALGFPKQEEWIQKHLKNINTALAMGIGGSFDVLSGKVKRAPKFWQRLGLEWFYRLLTMPSRWRRMLVLPIFLIKQFFVKNYK